MKIGTVYRITNRLTGLAYIGATFRSLSYRWSLHLFLAKKNHTPIARAIREYGRDAFDIEALASCFGREALRETEARLTEYWGTVYPNGYNLKTGDKHHALTKEKMLGRVPWSKGRPSMQKGVPRSTETKEKIRAKLSGYKHTDEMKKRISDSKTGVPNLLGRKPIVDQDGRVYSGVTEAAESIGVTPGAISMVLSGKRKSAKGKTFTFLER